MKSKLAYMLAPLLVLCMSFSFAQERTISGNVTDQSGMPLPGVSVIIVGTQTGTQTDFDGNYSINASPGQNLRFSYLGQKTVTRLVGSSSNIDVRMEEDAEALEEVVVQGYRTATKETSSISSQTITSATIENRPNANLVQTLSGQVAGLNITAATGQPGAAPNVVLRGQGSITGNNEPLYIIDGIPVDANAFRSLNPNDIDSFSVLRDAGATAIYGNRGANGVIIIKTRQGGYNQGLQINYTGITSFSTLQDNKYDLMDSQEQLQLERQLGRGRGSILSEAEIAAAPTFDWSNFFFDTGVTQNHTLNMSSGAENINQFTSLGYFEQEGILSDSDLKRFNIRSNINGKSSNDKFNYGLSLGINYSESNEPNNVGGSGINRNYILGAYQSVPYITADDYTNGADLLSPLSFANTPLFLLDRLRTFTRQEDEVQLLGSLNASYKITPSLTANVVLSSEFRDEIRTTAEGPESFNALLFAQGKDPSGTQFQQSTRQFSYNQVTSLNWAKVFGKHSLDIGVYTEYFKAHFQEFGYTQEGLDPKTFAPGDGSAFIGDNPDNDFYVDSVNANILDSGLFSYFGSLDYDYDTKYGFAATLRRDASYRFSGSNRWGTFWSLAGRWNIHNESFMDGSIFNILKLRASYGTTGNQNIANTGTPGIYFDAPDRTRDLFATGTGYGAANALFLSQIGNSTLQWETITTANLGFDFEMFNSRVRGTLEGYIRTTTDLYLESPISAINAVTELNTNSGELENRGVDFTLNYDVFRGQDFNLTLSAVGNFNEQEIIDLPTEDGTVIDGGLTALREGGRLDEYYTYRYAGVNPANGNLLFLTADGNVTENPDVDNDRVFLNSNRAPDWNGSFSLQADYKGWFTTVQMNYAFGVDRYDFDLSGFQSPDNVGQFRTTRDLLRAWTPDNRVTDIPALNATNRALGGSSDRYLRDADFMRLRFATIGYSFPAKALEGTGFSKVSIFANGENLLTFTKWRGFDVETLNATNVTQSRLYPTPRTFSIGFELGF
ncbi:SusC/RagA family TonB-linked outer membrane protein [Croceitalea dokdonensis]|nr:SusC/RagA family TonB-linked outer membrane protein [Croceitalea dokdonensis]